MFPFWAYLNNEYKRASHEGNGFVLQGDLNAWLGPDIIPGDNMNINQNGKMLVNFVKKKLTDNSEFLRICDGTTTWTRTRLGVKHVRFLYCVSASSPICSRNEN